MPDKRSSILVSATQIFAEKGFDQATITEIAKGAQMGASGIYTCFNSKEKILFSIIEEFLISCTDGLMDHLEGIQGAVNKLRKAVWFHCKSYSSSRKEIKIILESRSYLRFYNSPAYEKLKPYSKIFTTIIEEGMAEGVFYNTSSKTIIRDMILGTVDHVAINWTVKNGHSPLELAEHIFDLIYNAICCKQGNIHPVDKKELKRRQIINAATSLFAKFGYKDTNILEIARTACVAEGTIYDYYKNKENLLINIPEGKLGELLCEINGNAPENELKKIIHSLFNFHNKDRDYSTILVLMLRPNKSFYYSKSNKILDQIFILIQKTIIAGQKSGSFRQDLVPSAYKALLFGSIDHILIPWIVFNRKYDLIKVGNEVSKLFISAIAQES